MKGTHTISSSNEELYPSPQLRNLLQGMNEPGDCGNPPEPPKWLNKQLFEKGRRFYHKYLFCIFFSEILALMAGFSIYRLAVPLLFTGNSDTPTKAMHRYLSTVGHIVTWYQKDIWDPDDEGHRDLVRVRSLHKTINERIKNSSEGHRLNYGESNVHSKSICPISDLIRRDLRWVRKAKYKTEQENEPVEYFSQLDMVLTQYGFLGFVFTHPRMMGLWWVTKNELEGFAHFWRGIGWLLGIDDAYNLCNGTVDQIRSLCLEIEKNIIVKSLSEASQPFEEMSKALMEGMNRFIPCISYPSMLLYLTSTLNLQVPSLRQNIKWLNFIQYLFMRFIFSVVFLVPWFVYLFNYLLYSAICKRNKAKGHFLRKLN